MLLRYGMKNPDRIFQAGLIALALANIISYLVQRKSGLPESVADPVTGFVFGVAIATILLGVRLRAQTRKGVKS